jgi:hypothetical protein
VVLLLRFCVIIIYCALSAQLINCVNKCAVNNNDTKTQQQHTPNNEELGPGICLNIQIHQDNLLGLMSDVQL